MRILQNATLLDFALLTSAMHMAWLRHIGGRLKSDYRYSIGLVYNTFPMPPKDGNPSRLEPLAQAVLNGRASHPRATLSDLHDPNLMPPNLRRTHQALDRAVDRLHRRTGFASERERVEHLFMLYEKMRTPLTAQTKIKRRRKRGTKVSVARMNGTAVRMPAGRLRRSGRGLSARRLNRDPRKALESIGENKNYFVEKSVRRLVREEIFGSLSNKDEIR